LFVWELQVKKATWLERGVPMPGFPGVKIVAVPTTAMPPSVAAALVAPALTNTGDKSFNSLQISLKGQRRRNQRGSSLVED
jgi:hypothetical protein